MRRHGQLALVFVAILCLSLSAEGRLIGRSSGGMFSLTSRQLTETSTYAQTILSTLKEERDRTGKNKKWSMNELRDDVFKVLGVKNNSNNRNGRFCSSIYIYIYIYCCIARLLFNTRRCAGRPGMRKYPRCAKSNSSQFDASIMCR